MIVTVTLNASIDKRYVVDEMKPGAVMRVRGCRYSAGGKGLNVARVARLAGAQVEALGFVGGHAGNYIVQEVERMGIAANFTRVEGESRSCINLWDTSSSTQTELLEPGILVPEDKRTEFLETYREAVARCLVAVLSGSVPTGIPQDFYFRLIETARQAGRPVLLDTSGGLLAAGISAHPTFIKPNQDELEALTGGTASDLESVLTYARSLVEGGIDYVTVSLGKRGALLASRQGCYRGFTPDLPVINTVGCGDSMVAAFAVGLERGLGAAELLESALAMSTANALCEETGFFRQDDYRMLLKQVRVEHLS